MTNLERRALLGDAEAQRECTEKGIVLPCPFCGQEKIRILPVCGQGFIECPKCHCTTDLVDSVETAIKQWDTRAAPPVGRCGECKHSTNPAALTMIYGEPGTLTCHHGPCNRRNVNENDFCSYFEPKEEK